VLACPIDQTGRTVQAGPAFVGTRFALAQWPARNSYPAQISRLAGPATAGSRRKRIGKMRAGLVPVQPKRLASLPPLSLKAPLRLARRSTALCLQRGGWVKVWVLVFGPRPFSPTARKVAPMPRKPKQPALFTTGQDLPLFSGTPVTVKAQRFAPQANPQPPLFFSSKMHISFHTVIKIQKLAFCSGMYSKP